MNHYRMTIWESFTPTTNCSASATSTAIANFRALELSYRMSMCMTTLPHQRAPTVHATTPSDGACQGDLITGLECYIRFDDGFDLFKVAIHDRLAGQ